MGIFQQVVTVTFLSWCCCFRDET